MLTYIPARLAPVTRRRPLAKVATRAALVARQWSAARISRHLAAQYRRHLAGERVVLIPPAKR